MKSILIVASDMEIGGAERALLGLLESLDTKKVQVDLFLLHHRGPFMPLIPKDINLLPENSRYADLAVPIGEVIKKGDIDLAAARAYGKWRAKCFVRRHHITGDNSVAIHYSFRYTIKLLPEISTKFYDLALGFTTPYYILDQKVKARKKMVWLHTDYSYMQGDTEEERNVWSAYPYIATISKAVSEAFLKKFPELEDRLYPIENITLASSVRKQAELFDGSSEMKRDGTIRLLTVGRFTHPKNMDNIPNICAKIRNMGLNVKWYLIGYGGEEDLIREKIKESHMEKFVVILGKKNNPYPYIKECDLYVQPSRYEGKAVTVREAQMLCKPVVITDYPTASSQLDNGVDGIVVPLENEKCAEGIAELLKNPQRMKRLAENCKARDYSNADEVEKIYALLKD